MNPISSVGVPGRGEPARDAGAVPTDLAGMFAAIFAATTAVPVTPPPVPVVPVALPEGGETPGATPCAEGGMPSLPEGSVPAGGANGTPSLPALVAPGRPRHDRAGVTPSGVVPTLARGTAPQAPATPPSVPTSDDAEAPIAPAPVPPTSESGRPLPAEATTDLPNVTPTPVDPTVARMLTMVAPEARAITLARTAAVVAANPGAPLVPNGSPRLDVRGLASRGDARGEGVLRDLSAAVARDGLRVVASRTEDGPADTSTRSGLPGRAKVRTSGKGEGVKSEPSAPAVAPTEGAVPTPIVEKPTPVPTHAALAGMTPHAPRIETPAPQQVAAAAGPAPVPDEKPQTANPSHATVAFATPDGGEGRLRVSMRGDTLRATLHLPDASAAERIEQDLGGLSRALRAQGFEEARITVDVARNASADPGHDEPSPREQRQSREQQPHANERQPRRERGASREER